MFSTTKADPTCDPSHWSNSNDSDYIERPELIEAIEQTEKEINERLDENGCLTINVY